LTKLLEAVVRKLTVSIDRVRFGGETVICADSPPLGRADAGARIRTFWTTSYRVDALSTISVRIDA
jgi:hypothetical protein